AGLTWSLRARSTLTSRPQKPPRARATTARRKHSSSSLMAHRDQEGPGGAGTAGNARALAWDFSVEPGTGTEPALSAWESDSSPQSGALSGASGSPRVTVVACHSPGLMAR